MTVECRRRYRLGSAWSAADFATTAERLRAAAGEPQHSWGNAEVFSRPDLRFRFEVWEDWATFVCDHWGDIRRCDGALGGGPTDFGIELSFEASEATLRAGDATLQSAENSIALLEPMLALSPLTAEQAPTNLQGSSRSYFTRTPLTFDRLMNATNLVGPASRGSEYVHARIRLHEPLDKELAFSDLGSWHRELGSRWQEVKSLYLSRSGEEQRITLSVDLQRQLCELKAEAPTMAGSDALLTRLATELDLEEAPPEPYKYRRFSRTFKLLDWKDPKAFAAGARQAIAESFPARPAIVESYFTLGKGSEDLRPSYSIDDFLTRLGDASTPFDLAYLAVEGPHGKTLTIYLDLHQKQLRVLSALDRSEFNRVSKILEDATDLRLVEESEGEGRAGAAAKPSGDRLWVKLLLLAVGAFASVEVIKEAIPRHEVELVFPIASAEGIAKLEAAPFELSWVLRRSQWWDTREAQTPEAAQVTVLNSRGASVGRPGQRPDSTQLGGTINLAGPINTVPLDLLPGSYQLVVSVPRLGKSAKLRIEVAAKAGQGLPPPPTVTRRP